jgi:tetratricopeptide (TPR) repeat protein
MAVLLPFTALAAGASAQPAPASTAEELLDTGTDARTTNARALYREGMMHSKAHEWELAYDAFMEAWKQKEHWQIAANLAELEYRLGNYPDAAKYGWYYAQNAPSNEEKKKAETLFTLAQKHVGTVTVLVNKDGALVTVDGVDAGKSPLKSPLFVWPGQITITAQVLHARPPSDPYGPDLEVRPPMTMTMFEATAGGEDKVKLDLPGMDLIQTPPNLKNPIKEQKPRSPWPWVAAGVAGAAVGLGVGIGFTVAANGKRDDADTLSAKAGLNEVSSCYAPTGAAVAKCAAVNDAASDWITYRGAAIAGYIPGGVAAIAAVTIYALWPEARSEKPAALPLPSVNASSAGIIVVGAF